MTFDLFTRRERQCRSLELPDLRLSDCRFENPVQLRLPNSIANRKLSVGNTITSKGSCAGLLAIGIADHLQFRELAFRFCPSKSGCGAGENALPRSPSRSRFS